MSRKRVGRGRRYTVRVNQDGSQQYARRSCLGMIITAGFIIIGTIAGGAAVAIQLLREIL